MHVAQSVVTFFTAITLMRRPFSSSFGASALASLPSFWLVARM